MIEVNLVSLMHVTQAAVQVMRPRVNEIVVRPTGQER